MKPRVRFDRNIKLWQCSGDDGAAWGYSITEACSCYQENSQAYSREKRRLAKWEREFWCSKVDPETQRPSLFTRLADWLFHH